MTLPTTAMTYKQAMRFALNQINDRIEEIGAVARQAKEDGDDEGNAAARNFQNGFIECADLIDKMMMLVEISGDKPSRTCTEAEEDSRKSAEEEEAELERQDSDTR